MTYGFTLSFPDFSRRFFSSLARKVDTFLFSILDRFTHFHFHTVWIDSIMIWNSMIPFLLFGKNVCPWMGHSFLHRVSDVMAAAFIRPCCSAWQRYAIILIVFYPLWIIFFFHIFFCGPVSRCTTAGILYPILMCGLL